MISIRDFRKLMELGEDQLPLLTLIDFFENNPVEDAIAPNQYGYGRPSLQEMFNTFSKLGEHEDIAWIRVSLHEETEIETDEDGTEELFLFGESIVVCTSMPLPKLCELVNTEKLCSDGIIPASLEDYSNIPCIPDGYSCYEIVWD